jgi:hypothetical protein
MATSEPNKTPDVEALGQTSAEGWGDYPLDAVFVRTDTRTVSEVVKRIEANDISLIPIFQRDFVWSNQKQSKLIESCLIADDDSGAFQNFSN